jgi:dipeptidyl aminopeptidase/acylaminoacyl peptidase
VVPPAQSAELVNRLTAAHDEARLFLVKGAEHGLVRAGAVPIDPDIETVSSDISSFFFARLARPA